MEGWKTYKYTELCTLIGGGTPKTTVPEYWDGSIPWLSVKDFGGGNKYVYTTEKTITELGLKNSSTKLLEKIGEKIKAARLKQNITQDSLAESASISRSSVQKVESGEIKSFDTFIRILRTLGMLDEIYHLCEEEQLSPSEYYDWVNSSKKAKRRRAVGRRLRKSGKCEILAQKQADCVKNDL